MAWASTKMHRTTFINLDICQQMIPLWNIQLMALTYFFKVKKKLNFNILNNEIWGKYVNWLSTWRFNNILVF